MVMSGAAAQGWFGSTAANCHHLEHLPRLDALFAWALRALIGYETCGSHAVSRAQFGAIGLLDPLSFWPALVTATGLFLVFASGVLDD
jgi:hypothetical protein